MRPTFSYLNDAYFGVGQAAHVPEMLAARGGVRPLIVTDAVLLGLGIHARVGLPRAVVFDDVRTNRCPGTAGGSGSLFGDQSAATGRNGLPEALHRCHAAVAGTGWQTNVSTLPQ